MHALNMLQTHILILFTLSPWACNHMLVCAFSLVHVVQSPFSIIVQSFCKTAHYCLRNYAFAFILQFLRVQRERKRLTEMTKLHCFSFCCFSIFLLFCTDWYFSLDLKSLNLPSTPCHMGYFHIWQACHIVAIHHIVSDITKLLNCYSITPNRCFASIRAEARVSL